MSKIALEGNASGTGTFTIASPNSNSNYTLTLPNSTGTIVVTGGAQTIEFAAGTAAAPSITTTGDTNTGIYFPAADTIAFAEGGAEAARIDSAGNFGLGVTPSAWDSYKAIQLSNGVSFGSYIASTAPIAYISSNSIFNGGDKYVVSQPAALYQLNQGTHKWYTAPSGTAGNAITFTQAMTLNAAGNLLLGSTTAPTGFSRVSLVGGESSGSGANSGIQLTYNASTFGGGAITTVNAAGGGLSFYTFTGNVGSESYSERARITSGGALLIGTTSALMSSPTLVTSGSRSTDGVVQFANSVNSSDVNHGILNLINTATGAANNDARIMFSFRQVGATTGLDPMASIGAIKESGDYAAAIQFNTRSSSGAFSEKARITSGGSFLVGLTAAEGNGKICSLTAENAISARTTAAANTYEPLVCARSGNVGKAITFWYNLPAGTQAGYINIDSSTTVSINNTSDYRAKENIQSLTNSIDRVKKLNPVSFTFKADGYASEGFIAHEFAEVLPQAVHGEKDAVDENGKPVYQAMDQSKIIPLLTSSLKEAITRIEALEAEVAALKGQ